MSPRPDLRFAMWTLPPPPGFQGLREDKPLTCYLRHLPHWRQEGATYFVTFRLADSLPRSRLDELADLRRAWDRLHPPPHDKAALEFLAQEIAERVEHWLDQGMGKCPLKERAFAKHVTDALQHFDKVRYELDAYVIMPNHAHAIVRPLQEKYIPLEAILGSWKQYSARRINQVTGGKQARWQEESYDRIIRDEEHLFRTLQYVGNNGRGANLAEHEFIRWVRPTWVDLGWKFDM